MMEFQDGINNPHRESRPAQIQKIVLGTAQIIRKVS